MYFIPKKYKSRGGKVRASEVRKELTKQSRQVLCCALKASAASEGRKPAQCTCLGAAVQAHLLCELAGKSLIPPIKEWEEISLVSLQALISAYTVVSKCQPLKRHLKPCQQNTQKALLQKACSTIRLLQLLHVSKLLLSNIAGEKKGFNTFQVKLLREKKCTGKEILPNLPCSPMRINKLLLRKTGLPTPDLLFCMN